MNIKCNQQRQYNFEYLSKNWPYFIPLSQPTFFLADRSTVIETASKDYVFEIESFPTKPQLRRNRVLFCEIVVRNWINTYKKYKTLLRKRLLFIVVGTITISVLSFVSRCSHFEM